MIGYTVVLTAEARAGLSDYLLYIKADSPGHALRWLREIYKRIRSLEYLPERCAAAREKDLFRIDLRQLVYKSHRIIFHVDKASKVVTILYVRHAKRSAVGET